MIQIDIPMPKSCEECRFLFSAMGKPLFRQFMYRCAVTGYYIGNDDKARHPTCPLHEADAIEKAVGRMIKI